MTAQYDKSPICKEVFTYFVIVLLNNYIDTTM